MSVLAFLDAAKVGARVEYTEGERTWVGTIEAITKDEYTVTLHLDNRAVTLNLPASKVTRPDPP